MSKKKKEHSEGLASRAAEGDGQEAPVREAPEAEVKPAPAPSPEEELANCKAQVARNWDLYLRAQADLENYRKRAQREREDLARFANENLLREILPVADNLHRALEHARQEGGGNGGLLQGVELTLTQLAKTLEKFGVVAIAARGAAFDPAWHEAMGQVETAEHPPNTVVQELQPGYKLNERLLRPALVMVAKAPPAEEV